MKSIFDNLAENLRTWGNVAVERAGELTKVAAEKADELSKAGRLKMEIYQMERERSRLFTDLGQAVYEGRDAAGLSLNKIEKATTIEQKIGKINQDIAAAKAKAEAAAHLNDDVGAKKTKREVPSAPKGSESNPESAKVKKSPRSKKPAAKAAASKKKPVSDTKKKPKSTKKDVKQAD